MRAANQQDLVYKRGQAVTKASVTIIFVAQRVPPVNHADKSRSRGRYIAIQNVSKYLLNGNKDQQGLIQTLFQSVQLSINNPILLDYARTDHEGKHSRFIILLIFNMRPQEVLALVEEATGTRMFEGRKDKAKKNMSKKEIRVQEITSILEEEITPKLNNFANHTSNTQSRALN
ncbi:hypothetical protein M378DRAFT_90855 [Amanita muscaria Koide BX008]|uniref:Uncharacterized protein n=1 Tax=Amanita muscaria (strain Koide BX008) TaxID=946122 RepID=A0A0C2RVU9_AMAMK|nr:hypothetical protein M378DRAFT_92716 [Amanita muscaria Koide BX008]KIL55483.1 hypothetical protein M378DRAFT_90855 [Amanita muscaria Koide BX008]